MRTRIVQRAHGVRIEANDAYLAKLWVEPPRDLINALGTDVLARFARAFNIAQRIEGVTYALMTMLKYGEPGVPLDTGRDALVKILWGYLHEAAETIKALRPVATIVQRSAAAKSWGELHRMADIWLNDEMSVIRHELAFHPGELRHYRRAAENMLDKDAKLELIVTQGNEDGYVRSGHHAFPFAFQMLTYGMSFDLDPKRAQLAKQTVEQMRDWIVPSQREHLSLPLHLTAVFAAVLCHHGVDIPIPHPTNEFEETRTRFVRLLAQRQAALAHEGRDATRSTIR